MDRQVVLDIVQAIKPELMTALIYAFVAGFILLMLKSLLESCVAYAQFRLNSDLGRHVEVRVRGAKGAITHFNMVWITVRTEYGIELIHMKRWKSEKWAVLYDSTGRNGFILGTGKERSGHGTKEDGGK
ncbi:MAG: hypothetical protein KAT70_07750 [Thermoplasmata archaeon]|nr:hypothetical protein [Thermoplasmata archaeon]